jgi:uncharacterized protein YjiK
MAHPLIRRTLTGLALAGGAQLVPFAAPTPASAQEPDAARPASEEPDARALRWVDLDDEPLRIRLPGRLEEISGLAMTPRGTVLAHDDERARIYEIQPRNGEILREIRVGDGSLRGDFEGIALVGDTVHVVTSDGRLLTFVDNGGSEAPDYRGRVLGTEDLCEAEGLAWSATRSALLIACKEILDDRFKKGALVLAYDPATSTLDPEPALNLTRSALEDAGLPRRLQLSGIEVEANPGTWALISAQDQVLLEVTPDGEILGHGELRQRWHRQTEGITFSRGGNLILSDEGDGGRARLSLYPRQRSEGAGAGL